MKCVEFRGKDQTGIMNHSWFYGSLDLTFNPEFPKIMCKDRFGNTMHIGVGKGTVGQYTGITDINNKKIYELDVVQDRCGGFYLVKYSPQKMAFCLVQGNIEWTLCGFEELKGTKTQTFEVIGNIVDNPELINMCEQGCV